MNLKIINNTLVPLPEFDIGSQNTCVGGESISIGKSPLSLLTTGMGCTAIGYSNRECPAFGSGCENTLVGQAFSSYKDR